MVDANNNNLPTSPVYSYNELNSFIRKTQVKYNQQELDIVFFGGEPTLNYEFISDLIIEQDKELHEFTIRYILHTNGLLLMHIPDNILSRLSAIMLSINSLKIPPNHLNDSYFDSILSSIQFIKRNRSIPIVGRFTITEKTNLYTLIMQFHHFFDYVYWQIENCQEFTDYDNFYKSYTYELQLLINVWEGYLRKGVILKLIPFLSCAFFHNKTSNTLKFLCGFNHSMLYIQTDGQCYSCAEDFLSNKNLIGNINTSIEYPDFSLQDIRCNSCEYLMMCFGRCGRMHREFSEDHVIEYCKLNMVMFSYFKTNHEKISNICQENKISTETISFLTDYTEYVP
jgi:radical SAM protein with 4Fe4S-binding SPASM domain